MFDLAKKKVLLAGHTGMVGSALYRGLLKRGCTDLILRSKEEMDFTRQVQVEELYASEKPDVVIVAAAKVGGILANNTYRAEFLYDNLMIETNLIHGAYRSGVEKLIFLGSSCIYPKLATQPLIEESLLSGYLEYTNEPYAIAKITGIKLCENYFRQYGCDFFSVMPTNLYGPFDNFDLQSSHVLPAMIRKFHEAKSASAPSVTLWGTGTPMREFLFVEDLADAILFLAEKIEAKDVYDNGISHMNIGSGEDLTIAALAELIADIVGFTGEIRYDSSKPDGTPKKLMNVSRINALGWKYTTGLRSGIEYTYRWFLENKL